MLTEVGDGAVSDAEVEALVSAATTELDAGEDTPFWQLVDRVARLRELSDRELSLVSAILEVVAAHAARGRRSV